MDPLRLYKIASSLFTELIKALDNEGCKIRGSHETIASDDLIYFRKGNPVPERYVIHSLDCKTIDSLTGIIASNSIEKVAYQLSRYPVSLLSLCIKVEMIELQFNIPHNSVKMKIHALNLAYST
jgi:hypothetical protein